jgi:outer membrane immunogenic protein
MRKWFSLLLGLGLACGAAEAVAQAPPPPIAAAGILWDGPYVGVSGGPMWERFRGTWSIGPTPGQVGLGAAGATVPLRNGRSLAGSGGVQLGYNYQWGNIVLGLEGDVKAGGGSRKTFLTGLPPAFFVAGDSFSVRSRYNASVRGRVGYAWDRLLFYATGGLAIADQKVTSNFVAFGIFPPATATARKTLLGATAGGGFELSVAPAVSVGGEYRYSDYGNTNYSLGTVTTVSTAPGTFISAPVSARVRQQSHEVLFTLNYHFLAAAVPVVAPPPPPPPPPPPTRQVFLVFFDWDKDTITRDGRAIIQAAANAWRAGANVTLQVTGYTDASGSPGYNQRLSERRANNVANALAAAGVPRAAMVVSGRGMNDQRVPTAPGVREPQNRRVEIVFP